MSSKKLLKGQQTLNFKVTKRRFDDENGKEKKRKINISPSRSPVAAVTTPTILTPTKQSPLSKFTALEFTSPVKTTNSSSKRRIFDDLTTPNHVKDLPLPYKYQLLEEKFHNTNVILSMLEGRREICTFNKLQKSVQEIMRKSFTLKDVSQMKYLYPDSLILSQERHVPGTLSKQEYNNYQLIISSNVKEWSPSIQLERRKTFRDKLLNETIKHHTEYLSSLTPPVTVTDTLYRWHVNFELQSVPEIPQHDLPRPPVKECYNSATDLLHQTEKIISNRVQSVLESVQRKDSSTTAVTSTTSTASIPKTLKGVSPAIIERIRKKEAIKAALVMSRDPETEHQLMMLSRLPEMCRIIRSLFVTEGKAAILWSHLTQKIIDSYSSSLTTEQIDEHLQLLQTTVPQWIITVTVKGNKYMKLKDKKLSQQFINEQIIAKQNILKGIN